MVTTNLSIQVNGILGQNGASGSSNGGSQGGPAGQATAGGDAGGIDLFRHTDARGQVLAQARRMAPGAAPEDVTAVLAPHANVVLAAVGGAGGAGGQGGHGAHGRDGQRGRDAMGSSPGTNGGDGTDGGPGGLGSHGAAGGRGGVIVDRVPGADMDLFAASRWHVAGGAGGAPGHHGAGGRGGSGGSGGSSGSYQQFTGTDFDGFSQYNTVYLSGGSRGRDGRNGSTPSAPLHVGAAGAAGRVELIVVDGPDQGTYADRYRLTPQDFTIATADGHQFVEFGDAMQASARLQNTGPMPTPRATDLTVGIIPGMWTRPTATGNLPRGMVPGQSADLTGLSFNIFWPRHAPTAEPYTHTAAIDIGVETARGGVRLAEATAHLQQPIQFPLRLDAFTVDCVAYAGKPAQVRWSITNISDRPVGGDGRLAQSVLRFVDGDVQPDKVSFDSDDPTTVGALGHPLVTTLPLLPPGATTTVQGEMYFKADAEAYSIAEVAQAVHLSAPQGGDLSPIQERTADVQLAQAYLGRADAMAILLVNHQTTRAEIDAWRKVLGDVGISADIWNVSVYGTDALRAVFGHDRFYETCRNKTVIALNNPYTRHDKRASLAHDAQQGDLLEIAQRAGAATYIVGPEAAITAHRLMPTLGKATTTHNSLHKFEHAMRAGTAATANVCTTDVIDVRTNRRQPQAKHLRRKVDRLLAELAAQHPERNYTAASDLNVQPHPANSKKRNHLGTITLQRGLDAERHVATALPGSADALHTPAFVTGTDNRIGLYKTLPFAHKLLYLRDAAGDRDAAECLLRTIVSDLADEQTVLRREKTHLSHDEIVRLMPRLVQVSRNNWLCSNDAAAQAFAQRIHQAVQGMLRAHWYERARPWHRRHAEVDAATKRLLTKLSAPPAGSVAAVQPLPAQLRTEFDSQGARRV